MAYKCSKCKEDELSTRSLNLKICLKCGRIDDPNKLLTFLEKLGVPQGIIKQVKNFNAANQI